MARGSNNKDYLLFTEAWLCIAAARIMLVCMPFRKIVPLLKYSPASKPPRDVSARLTQLQLAIARAAARSPWRARCFEQALAAKMMTGRRGLASHIYFGVQKNDAGDKLEAHAWLTCDDFVVTGGKDLDQYTVVARFGENTMQ